MRRYGGLLLLFLTVFYATALHAKINYKYSYIPKKVFVTQVFSVTIISEASENGAMPSFVFDSTSDFQPIDSKPAVDTNGGNTFYTFYFKAIPNIKIIIPQLTIIDKDEIAELEEKTIRTQKLDSAGHENFCGLIASSCKIITSQVSEFDAQNNLVSLTIKTTEANPTELHVKSSLESGVEKITKTDSHITVEYYFVIPSSQRSISLSYYNTLQNRFLTKTISTSYKDKPVAAQVNLNPRDSSFDKIKKYGLMFIALFFFWMFWKRKDFFFLLLFAVSALILFILFMPHEKVCVQEGAPLYILPTQTSTTSGQVDRKLTTDILSRRGRYYKIEYNQHIIGWIKDEDICEN